MPIAGVTLASALPAGDAPVVRISRHGSPAFARYLQVTKEPARTISIVVPAGGVDLCNVAGAGQADPGR